jgi:hypothetical protein
MYRFYRQCLGSLGHTIWEGLTKEQIAFIMAQNKARKFSGVLGSIDCMHCSWKNCPISWQCLQKRHHVYCGVILEVVVDTDLWIWQVFFGMTCFHNDINMLQRSPVFAKLVEGHWYVANISIIFDAPCFFYTNLYIFCLYFFALLYIFRH